MNAWDDPCDIADDAEDQHLPFWKGERVLELLLSMSKDETCGRCSFCISFFATMTSLASPGLTPGSRLADVMKSPGARPRFLSRDSDCQRFSPTLLSPSDFSDASLLDVGTNRGPFESSRRLRSGQPLVLGIGMCSGKSWLRRSSLGFGVM